MSVTSVEAPAAFVGSVAQRIEHFPAHRVTCGPGLSNRLFPDRVPHGAATPNSVRRRKRNASACHNRCRSPMPRPCRRCLILLGSPCASDPEWREEKSFWCSVLAAVSASPLSSWRRHLARMCSAGSQIRRGPIWSGMQAFTRASLRCDGRTRWWSSASRPVGFPPSRPTISWSRTFLLPDCRSATTDDVRQRKRRRAGRNSLPTTRRARSGRCRPRRGRCHGAPKPSRHCTIARFGAASYSPRNRIPAYVDDDGNAFCRALLRRLAACRTGAKFSPTSSRNGSPTVRRTASISCRPGCRRCSMSSTRR
jgi:hypothetical protein